MASRARRTSSSRRSAMISATEFGETRRSRATNWRITASSKGTSVAGGYAATPAGPVITGGRGNRKKTGCVKWGCRSIISPFGNVASLILVARDRT